LIALALRMDLDERFWPSLLIRMPKQRPPRQQDCARACTSSKKSSAYLGMRPTLFQKPAAFEAGVVSITYQ